MEIERVDEEDFEMVATITRRLWLCRNTVVFGGDLTHSSQLVRSAQKSMKKFQKPSHRLNKGHWESGILRLTKQK